VRVHLHLQSRTTEAVTHREDEPLADDSVLTPGSRELNPIAVPGALGNERGDRNAADDVESNVSTSGKDFSSLNRLETGVNVSKEAYRK